MANSFLSPFRISLVSEGILTRQIPMIAGTDGGAVIELVKPLGRWHQQLSGDDCASDGKLETERIFAINVTDRSDPVACTGIPQPDRNHNVGSRVSSR